MNNHRLSNGHSSPSPPNLRKKRMIKTLLVIGVVAVLAGCVHHGYYGHPGFFVGGVHHGGHFGGHHSFGHGGFGHGGGHGH